MSERAPNMKEVLALLESGKWELGYGDGTRSDGRYWIQKGGLCRGGESRTVSLTVFRALEKRKLVEMMPRQSKQPFWLRRYRLRTPPRQEPS